MRNIRRAAGAGVKMSTQLYRFVALLQSVDGAIQTELMKLVPSAIRLLRLKQLKAAIKRRLVLIMTGIARTA
jgi:hypothetical protein